MRQEVTYKDTVIKDWMLDLGLTISEVVVYARIVTFTREIASYYMYPVATLANSLGMSERTVKRCLSGLLNKNLLEKYEFYEPAFGKCYAWSPTPNEWLHEMG